VARVLSSLTTLSALGLVPRNAVWDLFDVTVGFLGHPNLWIRQSVASFLASTARSLSQTDVWCLMYPSLRRLLRADISAITETESLSSVTRPVSRSAPCGSS
jgi:phosphoinositide-3-kinase regulatory subunit 4